MTLFAVLVDRDERVRRQGNRAVRVDIRLRDGAGGGALVDAGRCRAAGRGIGAVRRQVNAALVGPCRAPWPDT